MSIPSEMNEMEVAAALHQISRSVSDYSKSGIVDGCEWTLEDVTDTTYTPSATEPEQHPSRQIKADWIPGSLFRSNLRVLYPEVDLAQSHRRFVDHHLSRQSTSRSWEAEFRKWVSSDSERILERRGGTDDMGVPRTQRKGQAANPEADRAQQEELIDLAVRSARDKREQPDE